MAPNLQALVEKLTCRHCLGNGFTGWRDMARRAPPFSECVECLICEGSGINPDWDGDDF